MRLNLRRKGWPMPSELSQRQVRWASHQPELLVRK